jgi:hypothetical protein
MAFVAHSGRFASVNNPITGIGPAGCARAATDQAAAAPPKSRTNSRRLIPTADSRNGKVTVLLGVRKLGFGYFASIRRLCPL